MELKPSDPTESERNVNGTDNLDTDAVYTLKEIGDLIQQELENEYKGYTKIESLNDYIGSNVAATDQAKTVLLYVQSFRSRIQQDQFLVLANGDGGLATGIYICDIYQHKAEVELPPNRYALAEVPNPVGYNNISQQVLGITQYINSGPTGNKLVILTYTIFVKSNMLGQNINITLPSDIGYGFYYAYRIL